MRPLPERARKEKGGPEEREGLGGGSRNRDVETGKQPGPRRGEQGEQEPRGRHMRSK